MSKKHPRPNSVEENMADALDDLAAYQQFKDELLPELRQALARGETAEDLYKRYEALAAARLISIAAKEVDSGKAAQAAKDILDRRQGKAKERTQHEHKFSKVPDEQLDAILLSQLDELDDENLQ